MKITHIGNPSRSSIGVTQGLMALDCDLKLSSAYVSFGRVIRDREPNIEAAMLDSDLIFVGDLGGNQYIQFFDAHDLWDKVIHYDYRDTCTPVLTMLDKAKISFKRSITCGPTRQPIRMINRVVSIHHCALDEYYQPHVERDVDIGCFFNRNDPQHLGERRRTLVETLAEYDTPNSMIGHSTGQKQEARLAYAQGEIGNCFHEFVSLQHRCKIIFTAQPTHCEGDNRTWEAMASGALVFMDRTYHPLHKPLVDGEHCFLFDAEKPDTIRASLSLAKELLKDDARREAIAKAGFDYVRKYHRPVNRVRRMLWHAGIRQSA